MLEEDCCATRAPGVASKESQAAFTPCFLMASPGLALKYANSQVVAAAEAKRVAGAGDGQELVLDLGTIIFWSCSGSLWPWLLNIELMPTLPALCNGVATTFCATSNFRHGTFLSSSAPDLRQLAKMVGLEKEEALEDLNKSLPCWWAFSMSLESPKFLDTTLCNLLALLASLRTRCWASSCS